MLFEPDRRSLAFGVATLLAGVGTIAMPFLIPPLAGMIGWRGALVASGIGGLATLLGWMWLARGIAFAHTPLAPSDIANGSPAMSDGSTYGPILLSRTSWAIVIAKALSDMTWWFVNFGWPIFTGRSSDSARSNSPCRWGSRLPGRGWARCSRGGYQRDYWSVAGRWIASARR